MFLFEQMFDTALNGIAGSGLMDNVFIVAYGILLASLLYSAYEAWAHGGDVRALGVAAVKYLALGLLFTNGGFVYESVMRSVIGSFNYLAHALAGAGPGDVLTAWLAELVKVVESRTWLNLVTGTLAGLLSALLLMVAVVLYPVAYAVFAVFYALFGTILYVMGPLVLALMPALGVSPLARRFAVNFVIFGTWGLIYAILCRLTVLLNIHSMEAITSAGSFGGLFTAASAEVLLAMASILFSVCILLIPFMARRIVEGDVGSTMLAVLGTTAAMAQAVAATVSGSADGFGRMVTPSGHSDGGGPGGGSGGSGSSSKSGATGSSQPPRGPDSGGRGMGDFRSPNIPHAFGWLIGATAALGVKGGQKAVAAGKRMVSRPPTPPDSDGDPY